MISEAKSKFGTVFVRLILGKVGTDELARLLQKLTSDMNLILR